MKEQTASATMVELADCRKQLAEAKAELTEVVGLIQRLQPRGSPPPGGTQELVRWIVQTRGQELEDNAKAYSLSVNTLIEVQEQLKQAKAENARLTTALARIEATMNGHCGDHERTCECNYCLLDREFGHSTALTDLLAPVVELLESYEANEHLQPEPRQYLIEKIHKQLTRLRAVMERKI